MSDVVEVITGPTMADLRRARDASRAPFVELRLDTVRDLDVSGALEGRRTPAIVTCRSASEGGHFAGSEEERFRVLNEAIRLGAEYVDVEWRADRRQLGPLGRTTLVLSHHDFTGVPRDLADRVAAMRRESTGITKVVIHAGRLRDVLAVRDRTAGGDGRDVVIATGPAGLVTRACPWLFNSKWTFAGAPAPGQPSVGDLLDLYRTPAGTSKTELYAIAGAPLSHSASPSMHNRGFAAAGRDATYVTLETADADELIETCEALGFTGLSVTVPLKTRLLSHVPTIDDLSRRVGAINTIRRTASGWEGRNTDVPGFLEPLHQRSFSLRDAKVVVLGAGGAARAVVGALVDAGARVSVAARREDAAARLAEELGAKVSSWPPESGWDLLVNATSVGMWPHADATPLRRDLVRGARVYDLVYNPLETRLLAAARANGADVVDGLEMLVSQAVCQFEWWTGVAAPRALFRQAAEAFVAQPREKRNEADDV
jgi:3-dehydroquinate dehydratase/shikimate dehydrogenase